MKTAIKPRVRAFALEELAFFWAPRPWIPDIVQRFDWPGTSDVRDAIIMLDDEGGYGFLHWYADRASWGLTDKGKRWVEDLLSKAKLRAARDWMPTRSEPVEAKLSEPEPIRESQTELPREPELTREQELAMLAVEQAADDS